MKKIFLVFALVFLEIGVDARIESPWISTDKSFNTFSLDSIIKSVVKPGMSNDEKAIAIYDFMRLAFYHFQYPGEEHSSIGPLKAINVYGWGLCGGLHTVLGELYKKAGFKYRYRGWSNPGHTTIEVFYDGKWHYLDTFLCFYAWTLDKKTIAGQDDIKKDPDIALKAAEDGRGPINILSCGNTKEDVVSGVKSSIIENDWGGSVSQSDGSYIMDFSLMQGESLKLDWARDGIKTFYGYFEKQFMYPQHTCGMKEFSSHPVTGPILEHYGTRSFANGKLTFLPDLNNPAFLDDLEKKENVKLVAGKLLPLVSNTPLSIVFKMGCPYVLIDAEVSIEFVEDDPKNKTEFSLDKAGNWEDIDKLTKKVRGYYGYYVRVSSLKGIKSIKAVSTVQHNRSVLPFLVSGENKVTVTVKEPEMLKQNKLIVTYAYEEANVGTNRKQFKGQDIKYGEENVIVKEINKSPYEFILKVGGNTPPKMKYIKYEVK